MKNIDSKAVKQRYNCPEICSVELDAEISLALESSPPLGPDELYSHGYSQNIDDPLKCSPLNQVG